MNNANFAFTHMFSFPETAFCLPTSTFQIPLLTIDFYCLSLPENQASSLAPYFIKVVNLWFQSSNAFKDAGRWSKKKVKQAVLPTVNWRGQHLQRQCMLNIYLMTDVIFLKGGISFFANFTVPPEHGDWWLPKESPLLCSTGVLNPRKVLACFFQY